MSWVDLHGQLSWRHTFAALHHRNYRLWFIGQLVSLFGAWMQSTAQGYLVFELTRSPAYLGWVAFAAGAPSWLFMLYAGVIADRVPRRSVLLGTQAAMMAVALALAGLTFAGVVRPWHVLFLACCLGVATAFDAPARHAFVSDLVGHEDLSNAIALNSILFNSAVALGPAAGGVVYAWVGPAWCFTVNALTYTGVLTALLLIRLDARGEPPRTTSPWTDLREGIRYVAGHRTILTIIAIVGVVTVFGISYIALLPAWAVKILHGGARTNGLLQSARGVGAVLCALLVASLGHFRGKGALLTIGTFALPVALFLFSVARVLPLSLLALAGVGAAIILVFNLANTLVQTLADDALRGRVMGVYSFTFFGFLPLGALAAGATAEALGEPVTVAAGALVVLAFAVGVQIAYPRLRRTE
jgi:MFS family permease